MADIPLSRNSIKGRWACKHVDLHIVDYKYVQCALHAAAQYTRNTINKIDGIYLVIPASDFPSRVVSHVSYYIR